MDEINIEPFLSWDLGDNGGVFRAKTADELLSFVDEETEFWEWIYEEPNASRSGTDVPNITRSSLKTLRAHVVGVQDGSVSREAFVAHVEQLYAPTSGSRQILHSSTEDASFIRNTREALGDTAATVALAIILKRSINANDPEHLLAATAVGTYRLGINRRTPYAAKSAMDAVSKRFRAQAETDHQNYNELAASTAALLGQAQKRQTVLTRWAASRRRVQKSKAVSDISTAISDLKAVEAAYREQMALKAPVEYWSNKASKHEGKAKGLQTIVTYYAVLATLALLVALSVLACVAFEFAEPVMHNNEVVQRPAAVFLILTTIGVVVSTVAFWAGRVLVRLYLSELHLGMDARERETMVMTYLALIAEKATEGTDDRHIVLSSLFRPTADGIVKEDAAPDLSISGNIAKLIDQRR
ncbi:DUF6161 domain-containing protein [Mesorhizobium sp. DCY119]|uniref:DUF6161 domain-containing protein n=1 Tax=Mesorhizobium sp. DCY119 TaxID=2108445 RepID=UPI000E6BAA19|nr:DUF6161 domain-containing protein [Mesorhizobium sp. DCY119]RJG46427.1 hypothetical protein D3Y55_20745 [Mesorhizobium sp. DCY119]